MGGAVLSIPSLPRQASGLPVNLYAMAVSGDIELWEDLFGTGEAVSTSPVPRAQPLTQSIPDVTPHEQTGKKEKKAEKKEKKDKKNKKDKKDKKEKKEKKEKKKKKKKKKKKS